MPSRVGDRTVAVLDSFQINLRRSAQQDTRSFVVSSRRGAIEGFLHDLADVGDVAAEFFQNRNERTGDDQFRDGQRIHCIDLGFLFLIGGESSLVSLAEMHGLSGVELVCRTDRGPERADQKIEGIGVDLAEAVDILPAGT